MECLFCTCLKTSKISPNCELFWGLIKLWGKGALGTNFLSRGERLRSWIGIKVELPFFSLWSSYELWTLFSSNIVFSLSFTFGIFIWLSTCLPYLRVVIDWTNSCAWVELEEPLMAYCPFRLGIGWSGNFSFSLSPTWVAN